MGFNLSRGIASLEALGAELFTPNDADDRAHRGVMRLTASTGELDANGLFSSLLAHSRGAIRVLARQWNAPTSQPGRGRADFL
ncbi:MAG TPA: hypothetical protein VII08_08835 [Myxococcales bacterium]